MYQHQNGRPFRYLMWGVFCLGVVLGWGEQEAGAQQNWPSFRGFEAKGVAEGFKMPIKWDVDTSENILWRTKLAGLGLSSPIVWGNRIFITTAIDARGPSGLKVGLYGSIESVKEDSPFTWRIYCVDKKSGEILWEKDAYFGIPAMKRHPKSSHANSTCSTDGKHVVAFFASEGLFCYDMEGKLVWKKDLGLLDYGYYMVPSAQWGGGSSPIIHNEMVIIQCDVQENSFLAAFDIKDGKGDISLAGNELSNDFVMWSVRSGGNYMTTPIFYRDYLYCCANNGVLSCYEAQTGQLKYKERLKMGAAFSGSPVAADGKLYFPDERGEIFVVQAGPEYKLLGINDMGETCMATPAISDGVLFVRARSHLVAISEK